MWCLNLSLSVGDETLYVFSECTMSADSLSPVVFIVACLSPSYMTYIIHVYMFSVVPERSQAKLCDAFCHSKEPVATPYWLS